MTAIAIHRADNGRFGVAAKKQGGVETQRQDRSNREQPGTTVVDLLTP